MTLTSHCINSAYRISHTYGSNSTLFVFGVINSILAVPTAAANALVIVAILTTSSLQTPSYLLLTSLAFSDLAVGLLGQPILASILYSYLHEYIEIGCHLSWTYYAFSCLASWASIFTITAISVDRYLAIRMKMQYKFVVTLGRVRCLLVVLWIVSFIFMFLPVLLDITTQQFGAIAIASLITCLLIFLFCYTMSYRSLKIYCAQIQPQGNQQPNSTPQSNAIDVLKYRKLLKTMLLIVTLILLCYFALSAVFGILSVLPLKRMEGLLSIVGLVSIVNLNSLFNPVIYMTRMRDIRQACIKILNKLKCAAYEGNN